MTGQARRPRTGEGKRLPGRKAEPGLEAHSPSRSSAVHQGWLSEMVSGQEKEQEMRQDRREGARDGARARRGRVSDDHTMMDGGWTDGRRMVGTWVGEWMHGWMDRRVDG